MPVPTYVSPQSPATGTVLGATHENLWVRAIEFLHGRAAGGYSPFTGAWGMTGSAYGYMDEEEIYRGYYVYEGGPKYIYNKIWCLLQHVKIYASHDAGETLMQDMGAGPFTATSPIDMTAYNFTVGNKYYLRVTVQNDSSPSRGTGRVDWAYVLGANSGSLAWSTPTTFTDGNLSANTDLSNLTNNCEYLNTILAQRRANYVAQHAAAPLGGGTLLIWNGSFVYKGLNTLETSILHNPSSSVASLHIVDDNGTNDRTIDSINDASSGFATSYAIGGLSPALTIGNRYRLYVATNMDGGSRGSVFAHRIFISGNKALTNIPQRWNPGNYGYGSSGANREDYIAQSLSDIRAISEYDTVGGVDYGRQYLSQGNCTPQVDNVTHTNLAFQDFKFSRSLRFLMYLPTAAGASGTLTYGNATESLPDINGDGTWTAFDLETIKLLPLGFTYKVTGVKACIESASG